MKSNPNKPLFVKGDQVWYYNTARKPGISPKLLFKSTGPFVVLERVSVILYRIQKHAGPGERTIVVHTSKLKMYKAQCGESTSSSSNVMSEQGQSSRIEY